MLHHDPNISITLNTPHVTIERYSELTGLSIDTINDMLADGRIPRHRLRKDKKRKGNDQPCCSLPLMHLLIAMLYSTSSILGYIRGVDHV